MMGSQHPSGGFFSPIEVQTDHLPMCTDPNGTCPSSMVLHIKSYALHGSVADWFEDFPANKFSTLNAILDEFRKRWGGQKEHRFQLGALTTSHKKENETVVEFNEKFNNLVKSLHQDVKPPAVAILIYYIEAFEGEMRFALGDKDPQNLQATQETTLRIERNMLEAIWLQKLLTDLFDLEMEATTILCDS
jgi:hypothetical protein